MSSCGNILTNLPDLAIPAAAFKPYVVHAGLIHVSGQLPVRDGKALWTGQVPDLVSIDQAKEAAALCARNVLAWVGHACGGDFGKVDRCIRLAGFVSTGRGFTDAPGIINVASKMMTDAFGENGSHARIAIGVASLPLDAPVEIEAVFALRDDKAP